MFVYFSRTPMAAGLVCLLFCVYRFSKRMKMLFYQQAEIATLVNE